MNPLLLRRFPLAQLCSIEEVEHIQAKLNSSVSLEPVENGAPFEWRANHAAMGHLGIMVSSWAAGVRGYAPDVGVYSLLIGLHSGARVTQRGRAVSIAPGKTAALVSPGMDGHFEFGSEYQGLQVMIPRGVMSAALGGLTGAAQPALPRFEPEVDISSSGGASVLRLLRFVLDEVEQTDGTLVSPLVVGRLADTLVSAFLAGLPHDCSHLLRSPSRPAEPACLSRVEEYIRENLTNPITIADLAQDPGYAHMLSLGFSSADVGALQTECMDYFLDYYGIDFHGLPAAPDGTIVGDDAMMFGETIPVGTDERIISDTAGPRHLTNGSEQSRVVIDTGCAMFILSRGLNAGMPQAAGDTMVYGYSNVFDPKRPIDKDHIVERIKFKPAWPIKVVPVANAEGASLSEGVFKVEAEYVDKHGYVHNGVGICALSQYFDTSGGYHESKRDVYTFPE